MVNLITIGWAAELSGTAKDNTNSNNVNTVQDTQGLGVSLRQDPVYSRLGRCLAHVHRKERTSTLYPWSNLCPDWAIFRNVFPVNFCLHCGPHMTEINAEKMTTSAKSRILRPFSSTIFVFLNHFPFPRWFRPYADRSGDRRSRETILKIAQSATTPPLPLSKVSFWLNQKLAFRQSLSPECIIFTFSDFVWPRLYL